MACAVLSYPCCGRCMPSWRIMRSSASSSCVDSGGGGVGDESVFVRGERSDLAFLVFLKVNKDGVGVTRDAPRRGGAARPLNRRT